MGSIIQSLKLWITEDKGFDLGRKLNVSNESKLRDFRFNLQELMDMTAMTFSKRTWCEQSHKMEEKKYFSEVLCLLFTQGNYFPITCLVMPLLIKAISHWASLDNKQWKETHKTFPLTMKDALTFWLLKTKQESVSDAQSSFRLMFLRMIFSQLYFKDWLSNTIKKLEIKIVLVP